MQTNNFLIIKDVIIAIAAFSGMGLGFYNLWNEQNKKKVKLKVIPKSVLQSGTNSVGQNMILTSSNEFNINNTQDEFAIEIINLSTFPVVIDEVGFNISGTKARMSLPVPVLHDNNKEWPRKLESREAVTVYSSLRELLSTPSLSKVSNAFAKTSCGHSGTGKTEALSQLINYVNNKA